MAIIVPDVESGFIRENNVSPLSCSSRPIIMAQDKSCCFSGRCTHGVHVSGRFVCLKVSTVEVIMDCVNRDIVIVLGNELLMGWGGGQ